MSVSLPPRRASARLRLALLAAACALTALAAAPAAQAKVVVDSFGFPGPQGGRLNLLNNSGIAINQTGAGGVPAGTVYVSDANEGNALGKDANRIEALDPDGNFQRLWGLDVEGPNEVQTLSITFGAKGDALHPGGSFSLTLEGQTKVFALGGGGAVITPQRETVQSGLESLSSIGAGNVRVLGGTNSELSGISYEIEFIAAKGGTNLPQLVLDPSNIQGPAPITASVSTLQNGSGGNFTGFEICEVAAQCKRGSTTSPAPGGQLSSPAGIAVDQTSGSVYVSDAGDSRIEAFDATGHFLRAFGWDVVKPGGAGDVSANAFEICTVASDCKAGVSSQSGGAVGFARLAFDPAGHLWATGNNRLQEFEPNGTFIAAYGWNVVPAGKAGNVPANEQQSVSLNASTVGGTYKLQFGGTAPANTSAAIALNASAATLQSALEGIAAIGAGNVSVTGAAGGPYTIDFGGALADVDVAQLTSDNSALIGPQTLTIKNATGGSFALSFKGQSTGATGTANLASGSQLLSNVTTATGAFAVGQTLTSTAGGIPAGTTITALNAGGPNTLTLSNPVSVTKSGAALIATDIPYDASVSAIQAKLEALSTIGAGNVSVTGSPGGPYTINFTGALAGSPQPLIAANGAGLGGAPNGPSPTIAVAGPAPTIATTLSGNSLEKCTSTAPGDCQAGAQGAYLGQFQNGPDDIAFDAAANLYALDSGNGRIEKFNPAITAATQFAPNLLTESGLPSFSVNRLTMSPAGLLLSASAPGGYRLLELDATGQLLETSLAGDGLPQVAGLALNQSSGAIYASLVNSNGIPGVAIVDDGPAQAPPALTIQPATAISGEAATLNATVDPGGLLVAGCRFEYSTDQAKWKDVPDRPDCDALDRDGGAQPVSATLSGLDPATTYFFRVKAGRYYYAAGAAQSGEAQFTTISEPPLLSDLGAAQVTDTSAYLAGEVKPRSQTFTYHFAYGATPALGSETPTLQGTGTKQRVVATKVEGLQPDTTYYLRLIATNVAATTEADATFHTRPSLPAEPACGNQGLREAQHSTHLPECRAFEQVSPPEKNFVNPEAGFPAADGDAAFFSASGGFGHPPGQIGEIATGYRSTRTPAGWRTRWQNDPYCSKDLEETHFQPATGGSVSGSSENLDFLAILRPEASSCPIPPLDPAAPVPQTNLYRADFAAVGAGGPVAYDLLAPEPGGELFIKQPAGTYAAASKDFSRVFYTSAGNQTGEPGLDGDFQKLFEWNQGALKLVSVDPAGAPFAADSSIPEDARHGVSDDGKRVFFSTPLGTNAEEIYMRQNAKNTYDVSRSECTAACGESAADRFAAATPDGTRAFFISAARLTNDDAVGNGADLFLYTHSANPTADQNLTLLSKDAEPADGTGAGVLGLLGASDDGSVAYFAANGRLLPAAPSAAGPKLYRWDANGGSPTLTYLATLASGDAGNWDGVGIARRVTADGNYLLIRSEARIDPGADHDADADVYRWSAAEGWICLSCQVPDAASAGDATLPQNSSSNHHLHALSEDGARAFFATADPLLAADTNGRTDVYEWRSDGSLHLISTGLGTRDVMFLGASADGRDAFFITYQNLVGWDADTNSDLYDARVGGGFDEPPPAAVPCEGEACEGAPSAAPDVPGCGSCVFRAPPEKPKPRPCPKGKVHRGGKCVSRPCPKPKVRRHGRCVPKHHRKRHHTKRQRQIGRTH